MDLPVNIEDLLNIRKIEFDRNSWIDLVHFPKGPADKQFTEKSFKGPVHSQIKQTVDYINSTILVEQVNKVFGQSESLRYWNYPFAAIEEVLANSIYHRNYQEHEPVQVRIEPQSIYIYNLGGPDRSLKLEDFTLGNIRPKRYRNRRLGDFLKELELTEGRATGVPVILNAMKNNGSPVPSFSFDDERTWFEVKLPIHPSFPITHYLTLEDTVTISDEVISNFKDINSLISQIEETLTGISELKIVRSGVRVSARVIKLIDNAIHNNIQNISEISVRVNDRVREDGMLKVPDILEYCLEEHSRTEILRNIRLTYHQKNYKKFIKPLIKNNWLQMTISETPNHPGQKYYSTLKGVILLLLLKSSKNTGK